MEENKTLKEELVEKAKELAENDEISNKYQALSDLKKRWKRTLSEDESLFDKELADKFDEYVSVIEKKANELSGNVEEIKNKIIEQAKELAESENYKKATEKMNELFEQFKQAGRSNSKEADDNLWEQFKAAKDNFYERKADYYAQLKDRFAANKESKEKLVEQAKEVLNIENFSEATKKMNSLMDEWKKLGNAGKEFNDSLWASFSGARQEFFKKRSAYFEEMKGEYAKRAEAKKELIAKAKHCLAMSEFTAEEVAEIKNIRNEWKAVGFAGKDNEDALWEEFNGIVNKYFENYKVYGK